MYEMFFFGGDGLIYYLIFVVPALILSVIAQISVKTTFAKYSEIPSKSSVPGREIAELILRNNGIRDVSVRPVAGDLTDNYNPKSKTVNLSEKVYGSTSVAALGIAAHEAGHCCQHASEYFPIRLRNVIFPIASISSYLAMPLVVAGLVFNGFGILADIGLVLFAVSVLVHLVTLPVEFNASRRAVKTLREYKILDEAELSGTRKVLTAAAMTYVASLLISLMSFLRLILLTRNRRR